MYHEKITKIYGPPGTGKTTRLIALLQECISKDIKPNDIGFFSFTNFSTKVAKNKVVEKFPEYDIKKDFSGFRTLHSLAYNALPNKLNILTPEQAQAFDPSFRTEPVMLEEDDPNSLVYRAKQIVVDAAAVARSRLESFEEYLAGLNEDGRYRLNRWLGYAAKACDRRFNPHDIERLVDYIKRYESYKDELGVIDYTAILELAIDLEDSLPEYEVVFIDEAQDLSKLQWKLAEKLFGKAGKIYLAGDDDQAICESFGADPEYFVSISSGQEVVLEDSYRIPLNVHKKLFAERGVIERLSTLFTRKEKVWRPKDGETGIFADIGYGALSELVKKYPAKNWLIMAATHQVLQSFSSLLAREKIPHLLSNQFVGEQRDDFYPSLVLSTIWGAKGGEADIAVLLHGDYVNDIMLKQDPRLIYVAYTRTQNMFFRVNVNVWHDNKSVEVIEPFIQNLKDKKTERQKVDMKAVDNNLLTD